jgi:dephospho-CoA kinase
VKKEINLIAIVGMPGAGKSEAAYFFHKKGFPILRFGDQTDIGLTEIGKEINEKNERWYRESIRQELGMAAMAIKIEPRIIKTAGKHSTIILDGLYSWEEYVFLKSKFPHLKLLCIYASPQIRYDRLLKRKIRKLTKEEAKSRDVAELEQLNKGGPIAVADYLIKNEENKDRFFIDLEQFCKSHL